MYACMHCIRFKKVTNIYNSRFFLIGVDIGISDISNALNGFRHTASKRNVILLCDVTPNITHHLTLTLPLLIIRVSRALGSKIAFSFCKRFVWVTFLSTIRLSSVLNNLRYFRFTITDMYGWIRKMLSLSQVSKIELKTRTIYILHERVKSYENFKNYLAVTV